MSSVGSTITLAKVCVAATALGISWLFTGCGNEDVKVYRVAKEQKSKAVPHNHDHSPGDGHDHGSPALPGLAYKLPNERWEQTPPGEMRAASFRVKGADGKVADVGVFPLPGMAGSDLSNVNRWRGQVGLAAVEEDELAKLAEAVEMDGQKAQVYDMAGENPGSGEKTRILAGILRKDNVAWFFKMTGDDALVASEKKAFMGFLASVKFEQGKPELPPDHPPITGAGAATAGGAPTAGQAGEGNPQWQVPAGWVATSPGQFLVAKYTLSGDNNSSAAVNVSMSVGDGGGVPGNVNRWRRQLDLPEVEEGKLGLETLNLPDGKATLVDISGKDARTGTASRVVGVIVPRGGQTWFYKLMGEQGLVERQKQAFIQFVQSAKYPDAPR